MLISLSIRCSNEIILKNEQDLLWINKSNQVIYIQMITKVTAYHSFNSIS
jgi:hypothetical protein